MNYNLLLIISLASITSLFGMKEEHEPIKNDSTCVKVFEFNNNHLVDTFFIDNETIAIADNAGDCSSFCFNEGNSSSKSIFCFNNMINSMQGKYLKNVWYDPESKNMLCATNVYVDSSRYIKGKPRFTSQSAFLRTDNRWKDGNAFISQTVCSVDLKNMALTTYDFIGNAYFIRMMRKEDGLPLQMYPSKNTPGYIKSATFCSAKSLCAFAILNKSQCFHKVGDVNIKQVYKENKLIVTSTTDWLEKWALTKRARNIVFSPKDGEHIVYNSKGTLYISSVRNGNTITTSAIPQVLQKISSIVYDEDETHIHVIDDRNKKQAIYTHDGKYLRTEDVIQEDHKEVRYNADKTLKAVLEPHKVTIYKKEVN